MATIEIRNLTSDSFQARLTHIDTSYSDRSIDWLMEGERVKLMAVDDGDPTSDWVTFDGLDPDTEYNIEAFVYVYDSSISDVTTVEYEYDWIITLSEGEIGTNSWSIGSTREYLNINESIDSFMNIDEYKFLRIRVSFTNSGIAVFETNNVAGAYIFLSTKSTINENKGEPSSYLTYDYSSVNDIGIEYEVEAGTIYYVFIRRYDGNDSGKMPYIITPPQDSESSRPDYFEWDNPKVKGQPFNITADEWCRLLNNINDVRTYKGYSEISSTTNPSAIALFYYPSKGDTFLATNYNQCIFAFDNMGLLIYGNYSVSSGSEITADKINFLRNTINNVE